MRPEVMIRLLFFVSTTVALGGCDMRGGKQRYYTYCDNTGCYTCTRDGCTPTGGTNSGQCRVSHDCAEGCYCDAQHGVCAEAGFCDKNSDCGIGFSCNLPRHSCEPGSTPVAPGIDAGTPPAPACKADTDCPKGAYCNNGTCQNTFQCAKDVDCGAGLKCDTRNTCVPGPTNCAKDADCAAGAYCVNGACKTTGLCATDADCAKVGQGLVCDAGRSTCVPAPQQAPQCKADCDCPLGNVCLNGTCAPHAVNPQQGCIFNTECGSGQCVNSQCHAKCTTDANCGTGDTCQGGFCFPNPKPVGGCVWNSDCAAANTCVNGACHVQCKADVDCTNAVDFCDRGLCMPDWRRVPQCKVNADCKNNGEECVNAMCRTHCFVNVDCGACVGQPVCSMGYCSSLAEVSPQCKLQSDCGQGLSCVNASCK